MKIINRKGEEGWRVPISLSLGFTGSIESRLNRQTVSSERVCQQKPFGTFFAGAINAEAHSAVKFNRGLAVNTDRPRFEHKTLAVLKQPLLSVAAISFSD